MQRIPLIPHQARARQGLAPKAVATKAAGGGGARGPELPPVMEEEPEACSLAATLLVDPENEAQAGKASSAAPVKPARPPLPVRLGSKPAVRGPFAAVSAEVVQLAGSLLAQARSTGVAASVPAPTSGAAGAAPAVRLESLADPAVLALATDRQLAGLLTSLQPLLCWDGAARGWGTPGVAALLAALQASCTERLRRTSLACDAALAAAAGALFERSVREGGQAQVAPGLLAALAAWAHDNVRLLGGEVLAPVLGLLLAARWAPAEPDFGARCVERLMRLQTGKAGLALRHFAVAIEAMAQLRCVDDLSATPLVSLAVGAARRAEEGGQLAVVRLAMLARVMHSVAVIAATTTVQSATLLAATAAWHLLVVRAEAVAERQAAAPPSAGGPEMSLVLSRMWAASRLLMAAAKATAAPSFQLPDRLGLVSHAAWLDQERSTSGLTSAQRRVLAALTRLKVPPSKVSVNSEQALFTISVAVHTCVKATNQPMRTAILIRDPLRQLLRAGCGGAGAAAGPPSLGADAAQERLLQASGWKVVCLDSQTVLQLPVAALADELGAQMMGAANRSSLAFCA
ncbi:hypothetical protein C2E20_0152 [Micractinium conductrix]|uniref:RAP domain n=1 Tax=Micractinium conductrix TaxID=554055 RepID=A0A2P6VS34_9CHLO|nr:hypothetical protein C2E20_0152 [Micractinium conductrix]|eukprot:PSC76906.1 hypothetical protein C2E20_0152 [Micractinium conductrix]